MKTKGIDEVVNQFITDISAAIREEALGLMQNALHGAKGPKKLPTVARLVRRPVAGAKRSAETLEHTAAQILRLLKEEKGGLRSEQIQKKLQMTAEQLALPIKRLQAEGKIIFKGVARGRQYFAK